MRMHVLLPVCIRDDTSEYTNSKTVQQSVDRPRQEQAADSMAMSYQRHLSTIFRRSLPVRRLLFFILLILSSIIHTCAVRVFFCSPRCHPISYFCTFLSLSPSLQLLYYTSRCNSDKGSPSRPFSTLPPLCMERVHCSS